ncbi:glycosyltransferase [Alkalimarinus coralli]|uniref:glycosyltransferase n=1 Tax=Alkalimarinus coralli TaxID=2935863 RepID=UPI00202B1C0C|nr:glycosyltransferase [Alkalimarinus coralli]
MKPKLLYLSASCIPSKSANSVHVMKMCDAIHRQGVDTMLLSRKGAQSVAKDSREFYGTTSNFKIRAYPTIELPGVSFLTSLLYFFNIAQSSNEETIFYGRDLPSLLLCALLRKHFVYETHGIPHKKALVLMEKFLLKSRYLKGMVFISQSLKDLYSISENETRNIVLHDSADPPESLDDRIRLKGAFKFNVVYVGALYAGRGVDLIYKLAERLPNVAFHLFGGSREEVLREQHNTQRLQLENVFFYGYISPKETYKCRNSADVLLMPYQKSVMTINNASETSRYMSPLKLFEYMASRKPIISSDHRVLQEVLVDGVNALLCDPEKIEMWERAIVKLSNSEELRENLANRAYEDFCGNYTWDKRASTILSNFGDT